MQKHNEMNSFDWQIRKADMGMLRLFIVFEFVVCIYIWAL